VGIDAKLGNQRSGILERQGGAGVERILTLPNPSGSALQDLAPVFRKTSRSMATIRLRDKVSGLVAHRALEFCSVINSDDGRAQARTIEVNPTSNKPGRREVLHASPHHRRTEGSVAIGVSSSCLVGTVAVVAWFDAVGEESRLTPFAIDRYCRSGGRAGLLDLQLSRIHIKQEGCLPLHRQETRLDPSCGISLGACVHWRKRPISQRIHQGR